VQEQIEHFLLFRIRSRKDERAFTELFLAHKAGVYRYVRAKLQTTQDAEDAVSTTFLRLWNYLTTATGVDKVRPVLYTIARNVVADHFRHRGQGSVSVEALSDAGHELAGADNEQKITAGIDLNLIRSTLNALSDDYKDVIILRCLEGLSNRDVAVRLDRTERATYMLFHRALKELRKRL
jgi:RNA polymerase sigma-70 factor (ECF subfamily)